jgi:hypothetical protein
MSKYTDQEVETLLASGDAQKNEDGSITWAVENTYDKKPGTWLKRPPKAAPLITQETSAELARLRHDKRLQALSAGIALGGTQKFNIPMAEDETLMVMFAELTKVALDSENKDFIKAVKTIGDFTGLSQHKTKVEVDARTQTIEVSASGAKILASSPAIQRLQENNDGTG